jgi:hypothetical protein
MAMNEDSVVSSLNELRRMANERSRREAEARARLEAERRAWDDRNRSGRHGETHSRQPGGDPKTQTMTYGFPEATIQVEGYSPLGQWQSPSPAQTQTLAIAPAPQPMVESQTSRMSPAEWAAREQPMAAPPPRPRSAFWPVVFTALLIGGVAAAGFVKVRGDYEKELTKKAEMNAKLDEAKNQAVEAAARAEAQLKAQAASYEQRLRAAGVKTAGGGINETPMAATMAASPRTPPAAVAPKPLRRRSHRWWAHGGAAWGKRGSAAAAAAAAVNAPADDSKKANLPKIARKKKLPDDPLDGLKL